MPRSAITHSQQIQKLPFNPTRSTPTIYPNPFHHIIGVNFVRFGGYIWSY